MVAPKSGFSAPKGCCLVATVGSFLLGTNFEIKFQCPEGLLLGRNDTSSLTLTPVAAVSVPRRAVAWSQPNGGQKEADTLEFQCPEGLLLGRNPPIRRSAGDDRSRFSAPKGCCLVATNSFIARVARAIRFQCPEGLLLGRN